MLFVDVSIFLMFLIFGLIFNDGKGAFLISGYNTLPKDKKAEYDVPALLAFMSKIMFLLALGSLLLFFSHLLNQPILFYFGIILFSIVTLFTLIYSNTGNRFKKNKKW